jgi:hypothetical protein
MSDKTRRGIGPKTDRPALNGAGLSVFLAFSSPKPTGALARAKKMV